MLSTATRFGSLRLRRRCSSTVQVLYVLTAVPQVDKAGMLYGIEHSAVVLLIMTTGIFQEERHWVTHVELKTAIDANTPIIAVRPSEA